MMLGIGALKKTVAAATMLLAVSATAQAAVILTTPVTLNFGPDQTDFTSSTLNFAQFNPVDHDGHTLNSVHITLSGTSSTSSSFLTCAVPGGGGFCSSSLSSQIQMTLSTVPTGNLNVVLPLTVFSNSNYTGTINPAPNSDTQSQTLVFCVVNVPGCTSVNPAIVAAFSGAGTIAASVFADGTSSTINNSGFAFGSEEIEGSGFVTLSYDYLTSDIPEPATMTLFGVGLLGLIAARRRRQ